MSSNFFNYNIISAVSTSIHKSEYYIIVDLNDNKMYVYKGEELYKTYPVSGGTASTPSPLGTWKIISEANWGEGFGGTWMGFNVPWGQYGIHGTDEPYILTT
ncbi:MAG: hypothetical protein CVV02_01745 [Firmicutes bacterium HGW-Firmicutes-7]|nr:MAG: hypothetical protein CVV02_01745 [Firmicutes bacterium HGW-Firmicutes-7]